MKILYNVKLCNVLLFVIYFDYFSIRIRNGGFLHHNTATVIT